MKNKRHDDDQKSVDPLGSKKGRMVWSLDLHQKFVDATIQIGFDTYVMVLHWRSVDGNSSDRSQAQQNSGLDECSLVEEKMLLAICSSISTDDSVELSIMKYRFYLSKLLKENEVKTSQGMKQQDFTRPGSFGFQTSTLYTGNNTLLIDMGTRICREADMKATASILSVDLKETSASNFLDRQRQVLVLKPFFPILSTTNHTTTQTRNEVLMEQFKQPPDQDPDLCALLDDDLSHTCSLLHSIFSKLISNILLMLLVWKPQSKNLRCHLLASKVGMKNQVVNLNCLNDWEPTQQKVFAVSDSSLGSLVGCAYTESIGLQDLLAELEETCYYDHLGFEWSNDWDSIQNPVVDQGLLTAQATPQGLATIVSNWKTREHFLWLM
ncbi:hypothetical protein CK203_058946 [Vitis vinifera]|uniref:Uncharacterized protein n=1 Tax=Vitis vinifera TaxID=29760 RepID=A0A438FQ67_VITVI|nr:hypothetical protein CK203_058946 [Vitis vinifera]